MIELKSNDVYKIEVQTTDNFKTGDVDVIIFLEGQSYGETDIKIGKVNINLDENVYHCFPLTTEDEEEFYYLAEKLVLNKLHPSDKPVRISEFGKVVENSGEILKKFTKDSNIEPVLKSEYEILEEYEEDLKRYHLCHKPERQFLQ